MLASRIIKKYINCSLLISIACHKVYAVKYRTTRYEYSFVYCLASRNKRTSKWNHNWSMWDTRVTQTLRNVIVITESNGGSPSGTAIHVLERTRARINGGTNGVSWRGGIPRTRCIILTRTEWHGVTECYACIFFIRLYKSATLSADPPCAKSIACSPFDWFFRVTLCESHLWLSHTHAIGCNDSITLAFTHLRTHTRKHTRSLICFLNYSSRFNFKAR